MIEERVGEVRACRFLEGSPEEAEVDPHRFHEMGEGHALSCAASPE